MSVSEVSPYCGGVRIREVSVLQVSVLEVSILQSCPYERGVRTERLDCGIYVHFLGNVTNTFFKERDIVISNLFHITLSQFTSM